MLTAFRNAFRIHDLRNKILFTLFIFVLYRFGTTVPVPGVDLEAIKEFTDAATTSGFVGLLNLFSGGALTRMSVFALGIMPYITSSIILQLLAVVIPKLQALQEEGETGRKVITQWTRYLTVILALLQATGFSFLFHSGQLTGGIDLIPDYTPRNVIIIVITMTAGTALLMWFGELITQRGIGNGMSLLIFISIISQIPSQLVVLNANSQTYQFVVITAVMVALTVGIIYIEQGQRRIPVQFSKRVRGRKVMGGQSTYIPLKVNMAGVIPVIFATSIMYFRFGAATGWLGSHGSELDRHQFAVIERWRVLPEPVVHLRARSPRGVLHLLLHGDPVRSGTPGRHDPTPGWVHSWYSSGTSDRAVPCVRAQPNHAARCDVLGDRDNPAVHPRFHLERPRRTLRRVDHHRCGRCPRDNEADRVPADDEEL